MRGLAHGWLEADLVPAAEAGVARAWAGLAGRVAEDGTVTNIIGGGDQHWATDPPPASSCAGTGVKNTAAGYSPATTEYSEAAPGVGAVLIALAEMVAYQEAARS